MHQLGSIIQAKSGTNPVVPNLFRKIANLGTKSGTSLVVPNLFRKIANLGTKSGTSLVVPNLFQKIAKLGTKSGIRLIYLRQAGAFVGFCSYLLNDAPVLEYHSVRKT